MPRKQNKLRIPSSIPTLHSDIWCLVFKYCPWNTQLAIICTCVSLRTKLRPFLLRQLAEAAKPRLISIVSGQKVFSFLNEFYETVNLRLDFHQMLITKKEYSLEAYLQIIFDHYVSPKVNLPQNYLKVEQSWIQTVVRRCRPGDFLCCHNGGVTFDYYYLSSSKGKFKISPLDNHYLPTAAINFLNQNKITTLAQLRGFCPLFDLLELKGFKMADNRYVHLGQEQDGTRTIYGYSFHVKPEENYDIKKLHITGPIIIYRS
jgi:hypothetical protein